MTRHTLDIQITIDDDLPVAMVSSAAMQYEAPVRLAGTGRDVDELFMQWMEMVRDDRSCLTCYQARLWEEDGNPCFECGLYENTENVTGRETDKFRRFYAYAMDRGFSEERTAALCPRYTALESVPL